MATKTMNELALELVSADLEPLTVTGCQTTFSFATFGVVTSGSATAVTISLVTQGFPFFLSGDLQGTITPQVPTLILIANLMGIPISCTFSGQFDSGDVTANILFNDQPMYNGPIGIVPAP